MTIERIFLSQIKDKYAKTMNRNFYLTRTIEVDIEDLRWMLAELDKQLPNPIDIKKQTTRVALGDES